MRWGPSACLPAAQAGHGTVIDAKTAATSNGGAKTQLWAVAQAWPALQLWPVLR